MDQVNIRLNLLLLLKILNLLLIGQTNQKDLKINLYKIKKTQGLVNMK